MTIEDIVTITIGSRVTVLNSPVVATIFFCNWGIHSEIELGAEPDWELNRVTITPQGYLDELNI